MYIKSIIEFIHFQKYNVKSINKKFVEMVDRVK